MSFAIAPFCVCLFLILRLRKLAKFNNVPEFDRPLFICLVSVAVIFGFQAAFQHIYFSMFIWNAILFGLTGFMLIQKKIKIPRMLIWAVVPYAVLSFISNITDTVFHPFYLKWEDYIDNAEGLSFMWMLALVFSQNRQSKIQEKERIKKQQEDELNKAIALRKVELEGEVAARTAELTKQKDELQHALTDLQATQAQLIQSEKMASLGELTAGIAHEIQNPLNFVNNFSEVSTELVKEMMDEVAKGNVNEVKNIATDLVQNLEKITHHGKRADAIVKGMLQHSRSSSGQKEMTDINALTDEYMRLSYHGLRAKEKSFNATLKSDFDESVGKINIVSQDIGRVILNLLNNAFYAVSDKKNHLTGEQYEPTVSVKTKKINNKVEITISDNGNGIPQNVLDKIFQPFFTTKPTGKGTGLGLSLSYDIITKGHNGELKVETKEGAGTSFHIILPAGN